MVIATVDQASVPDSEVTFTQCLGHEWMNLYTQALKVADADSCQEPFLLQLMTTPHITDLTFYPEGRIDIASGSGSGRAL